MRIRVFVSVCSVLMIAALLPGLAFGDSPARPTTTYQSTFQIVKAPAQFDEVFVYAELAPGAGTPTHIHGGNQYVTVLAGVLTRQVFSPTPGTLQHPAGDTWSEITGEVHQVRNLGTIPARSVGTFLLPHGAALTTIQKTGATSQQLPGPKTLAQAKLAVDNPPAQFDLRHLVLDFVPGTSTADESYGGQALSLVLEGSVTVRANGTDTTYKAGESWSNPAGQVFAVSNPGSDKATVAVSVLLPSGATLITQAPAAITTASAVPFAGTIGFIALAAAIVVAGAVLLRRSRVRA